MKIVIYRAKDGDWHIRISGKNNRVMFDAAGYNTRQNAVVTVATMLKYASEGNYSVKVKP